MSDSVTLVTLEDTRTFARELASILRRGDVVALQGDLGSGKTTFVRYLVEALGGGNDVTSPTFTLLQTYPVTLAGGTSCDLYHYDLYRVERASELAELGLEEAVSHLTVIEWPERLPDARMVTLALSFTMEKDGTRCVRSKRIPA